MTPIQYFVLVFKKGDQIKAIAFKDAKQQETALLADGWNRITKRLTQSLPKSSPYRADFS